MCGVVCFWEIGRAWEKACYKVIIFVVLLEERLCQKVPLLTFVERSLLFVYCVLLALESPPLSVAEGKWWWLHQCLVSPAFTGWEKWSFTVSSSLARSSPVFPLWCLWLLRSCCSRDAGAGGAGCPSALTLGRHATGVILHRKEAAQWTWAFRNVACSGGSMLLQIYQFWLVFEMAM